MKLGKIVLLFVAALVLGFFVYITFLYFSPQNDQIHLYTVKELSEAIIDENSKQYETCIPTIQNHIFAFPGYKYKAQSGYIRPVIKKKDTIEHNTYMRLDASYEKDKNFDFEFGQKDIDTFLITFMFDVNSKSCQIIKVNPQRNVVPRVPLAKAKLLTILNFRKLDLYLIKLPLLRFYPQRWFSNVQEITNYQLYGLDFEKPTIGGIQLYAVLAGLKSAGNPEYQIFVDVFSNEVIIEKNIIQLPM